MTQFHSDDYVEFLSKIIPSNMSSYVREQHKCALKSQKLFHDPPRPEMCWPDLLLPIQITSEMIVLFSMVSSTIAPSQPVGPWVSWVSRLCFFPPPDMSFQRELLDWVATNVILRSTGLVDCITRKKVRRVVFAMWTVGCQISRHSCLFSFNFADQTLY